MTDTPLPTAPDLERAYARLSQDRERTESYLQEHGFTLDMYDVGSVSIVDDFNRDRVLTGYTFRQTIKVETIKAATENTKLQAAHLVETTGRQLGSPVSARLGVFQIRPQHSQQDVSGMGMSDVTSIEKEIVSTVHINFLFEV